MTVRTTGCRIVAVRETRGVQKLPGDPRDDLPTVDDQMRHRDDQPSIGLIICKDKKRTFVEYALRDSRKPIGVSAHKLTSSLPARLRGRLPTVKEFEAELARKEQR